MDDTRDVFVSYKREDRSFIDPIRKNLLALGLTVWDDFETRAGVDFQDEMNRRANAAKCVLVCWSKEAFGSVNVKGEALIGLNARKLVSVVIRKCDLEAPYNIINQADLSDWDGSADDDRWLKVVDSIGDTIERRGALRHWAEAVNADTTDSYRAFVRAHPTDVAAGEGWSKVEQAEWKLFDNAVGTTRRKLIALIEKDQDGVTERERAARDRFSEWLTEDRAGTAGPRPNFSSMLLPDEVELRNELRSTEDAQKAIEKRYADMQRERDVAIENAGKRNREDQSTISSLRTELAEAAKNNAAMSKATNAAENRAAFLTRLLTGVFFGALIILVLGYLGVSGYIWSQQRALVSRGHAEGYNQRSEELNDEVREAALASQSTARSAISGCWQQVSIPPRYYCTRFNLSWNGNALGFECQGRPVQWRVEARSDQQGVTLDNGDNFTRTSGYLFWRSEGDLRGIYVQCAS